MTRTPAAVSLVLALLVTGCGGAPGDAGDIAVAVSPTATSIPPAGHQQFAVAVTGTGVTAVTWSIEEGAPGGTVSASGLYTAPGTAGTYHVVVRSAADTSKAATAVVTVTASAQPVAVQVNPASTTVQAGGHVQFTASVSNASDTSVTWAVTEGPAGGSVDAAGLYVAPATAGTFHVTATSVADPTRSSTATVVVTAAPSGGSSPWVSAYYAGWFWDQTGTQVDMTAMTHFIFGRVAPGGGTLGGAAGAVMPGAGTAHDPAYGPGAPTRSVEQVMIDRAHAAGIKALLMMGGVGDGPGWVASTANPTIRATFIQNILDYLVSHDYDGVDIDWEDSLSTATQQAALNDFLAALRAAANARARYQSPHAPFLITFPGYVLNVNVDLPVATWKVTTASLVDQYNLMSYAVGGAYGGWDTWFFCPVFGQGPTRPVDLDSTIRGFVAAGVPASKLGIGIGFYGQNYSPQPAWVASRAYATGAYVLKGIQVYRATKAGTSGSVGPSGTGTGIVDGTVTWSYVGDMGPRQPIATVGSGGIQAYDVEWSYANILSKYKPNGTYHWDDTAKQGYLLFPDGFAPSGGSRAGYLTYEDENSIAAKGAWVRSQGVGGTIIWVVNYGVTDVARGTNPLLDATKRAFLQ